ncbi:putative monovalent cation/H+ antiporter subunit A [Oceanisphaera pacifica]|uniref:Monovalent cation/H+ antiporter subunit A n=1 Tax=Oceanisphaera pacifica TaxID=2818389 RepID=A0ABS3NJX5_9GAMM|nr:putative monovalent cation/H+ antiporter subunit A [Oceanisphaera pacifica]MBO1520531.1 putative monovalent cation/H+ antiporter subunit A [Oceanisphaera pacifica]
MLVAILAGFILALLVPRLAPLVGDKIGWYLSVLPALLFVYFLGFWPEVTAGETLHYSYTWIPSLDINLSFMVDGLSLMFALLITGIGTFIFIYAGCYLHGHKDIHKLLMYLQAFMAAMLGLVLSSNLIAMFVFWELTSFTSYLLIGFNHEQEKARKAALQGFFITVGGGLALMTGLILLGYIGGSFEITELLAQGTSLQDNPLFLAMMGLILLGTFTKSAQTPFHFWLPNAMAAPTPVSAYLHSATMVKAGVYLMARLQPMMAGYEPWAVTLSVFGGVTMTLGAIMAVCSTDLKRILAFSTVMALGTLTMLIGIGTPHALEAAMVFLLAHALYKGALFMAAGTLDHVTGTKDVRELGGLRQYMPHTTVFVTIAALSLAGIPPLFGFIAKELMFSAALTSANLSGFLIVLSVITAICIVAASALVAIKPFYGAYKTTPQTPHEAPWAMRLGFSVLAVVSLLLGLIPGLISPLLQVAIAAISGAEADVELDLALWHGINVPLMLSGLALVCGAFVYRYWQLIYQPLAKAVYPLAYGPERGYEHMMNGLVWLARTQTRILQNGYMANYILTILISTIALLTYVFWFEDAFIYVISFTDVRFYEVVIALLMLVAVLYACVTPLRLGSVAALGVLGFAMTMVYVFFSAPDLAITQVLVETLTVIMLVLVLFRLPGFHDLSSPLVRWRDAAVAGAFGVLVTMMLLTVNESSLPSMGISEYLVENSYVMAHGRNIVNVILVDFRALDTLGEIFVLALAAIGVNAMIRFRWESQK